MSDDAQMIECRVCKDRIRMPRHASVETLRHLYAVDRVCSSCTSKITSRFDNEFQRARDNAWTGRSSAGGWSVFSSPDWLVIVDMYIAEKCRS